MYSAKIKAIYPDFLFGRSEELSKALKNSSILPSSHLSHSMWEVAMMRYNSHTRYLHQRVEVTILNLGFKSHFL